MKIKKNLVSIASIPNLKNFYNGFRITWQPLPAVRIHLHFDLICFENVSVLTKDNRKFVLELKERKKFTFFKQKR